jgi:hypothetical protein
MLTALQNGEQVTKNHDFCSQASPKLPRYINLVLLVHLHRVDMSAQQGIKEGWFQRRVNSVEQEEGTDIHTGEKAVRLRKAQGN